MKNLILVSMLAAPLTCFSYDDRQAKSNIASEFAECSAYFMLVSEGMKVSGALEEKSAFMDIMGFEAYKMAEDRSNEQVTQARIQLSLQKMNEEMGADISNGAILINKYGRHCKNIMEDPEARMKYWLDK